MLHKSYHALAIHLNLALTLDIIRKTEELLDIIPTTYHYGWDDLALMPLSAHELALVELTHLHFGTLLAAITQATYSPREHDEDYCGHQCCCDESYSWARDKTEELLYRYSLTVGPLPMIHTCFEAPVVEDLSDDVPF